ncbi:MAG: oxygen-independent coproporphyrinogen III oxidase [Candidatus Sericytochromatia bacterium]|nr:oxygen-independent coproporphyrinogen III oxidase [Candidatus Sericytochromatia bacterium]
MSETTPPGPYSPEAYLVPREILARYDVPGPRYTSYPTAPEWSDELSPENAVDILRENSLSRARVPLSLYVHIPFCHNLCFFCGCNMWVTQKQDLVTRYLNAIETEIARVSAVGSSEREVVQIHWGGGTPTYLSSEQIERLFLCLKRHFNIRPDAEISLELHPSVTSFDQLATLRSLGFNRVSMGIQDFDPLVQKTVNRIQPFEVTRDLIAECRRLKFLSVNTDLMYGLPHQTPDGFAATLKKVEQLNPDRLALFNYAHVPWLKKHQGIFKEDTLPRPDVKLTLFEMAVRHFIEMGYRYIGMDHFARGDDELTVHQANGTLRRNFMGYTTHADSDLYAFGPSAIADLDRAYLQNERNVHAYIDRIEAGGLPTVRGLRLSDDDRLRRDVINRLFCLLHVNKGLVETLFDIEFDSVFGSALEKLAPLEQDGLLRLEKRHLRVTPRGQILLRNIAMVFDAYLARTPLEGRRFSRTV